MLRRNIKNEKDKEAIQASIEEGEPSRVQDESRTLVSLLFI